MSTKTTDDATVNVPQAPAESEPKKLLLGKRVIRHFNVKSSIQTGAGAGATVRVRCGDTTSSG